MVQDVIQDRYILYGLDARIIRLVSQVSTMIGMNRMVLTRQVHAESRS